MANKYGPKIINDGLVLCIDAAGDNKSYPVDGLDIEYLIVAGGGGGGSRDSGAGGAGGLLTGSTKVTIATGTYSIVVGAGGSGGVGDTAGAGNGSNSTAFGDTAIGGGRGGQYPPNYAATGGSGGGGHNGAGGAAGTAGQGYAGGDGNTPNSAYNGGGGGGAGGEGGDSLSDSVSGGDGGIGRYFGDKYSTSLGENGWFAGGGGAGGEQGGSTNGTGGLGGGGDGHLTSAQSGSANTGGGGGSNRSSTVGLVAGSGGSGVVLIRYSGPPRAKGGDSIISHRGYTVHVFNSSGNFIVGETVSDLSRTKTYATLTNMSSGDYTRGAYWSFDGSNQRLLVPHNSSQPYDLTYEAVVFLNTLPCTTPGTAGCYRSIWQKSVDWNGTTGISLQFIYGYLRFSYGQTWGGAAYYNQSNFQANKYYHIVGTSSSTSSGTMKLYVNGILVSTGTGGTPTTTNPLWIGYGSAGGINGRIPLFKSYSIELSQEQILTNFNAIRGRYGI